MKSLVETGKIYPLYRISVKMYKLELGQDDFILKAKLARIEHTMFISYQRFHQGDLIKHLIERW